MIPTLPEESNKKIKLIRLLIKAVLNGFYHNQELKEKTKRLYRPNFGFLALRKPRD